MLSSDMNILHLPIRGSHCQLDDHLRNPRGVTNLVGGEHRNIEKEEERQSTLGIGASHTQPSQQSFPRVIRWNIAMHWPRLGKGAKKEGKQTNKCFMYVCVAGILCTWVHLAAVALLYLMMMAWCWLWRFGRSQDVIKDVLKNQYFHIFVFFGHW